MSNDFAAEIEKIEAGGEPLVIVGTDGTLSAILISPADFGSEEETAYLLSSPKNARRLLKAIARFDAGEGTRRKLAE